jgi:two-component system sensor histidine kinase UhpB
VSRTLRPVATLAEGLKASGARRTFDARSADGSPEFVIIAERINALAATLQRLDEENRKLVRRMIHVQDEERKDIARDLHDEIGPFLFAVRAGVGALARRVTASGADPTRLAEDCARIVAQIAALQQVNRRILGRLRPAALEEMGLADALEALAQGWREPTPKVAIALSLDGARGHRRSDRAHSPIASCRKRRQCFDIQAPIESRLPSSGRRGALHIVVRTMGRASKRLVPRPRAVSACAV